MAEEQSTRLKNENQDLVDRWMARMGKEAEAMNDASKYSWLVPIRRSGDGARLLEETGA